MTYSKGFVLANMALAAGLGFVFGGLLRPAALAIASEPPHRVTCLNESLRPMPCADQWPVMSRMAETDGRSTWKGKLCYSDKGYPENVPKDELKPGIGQMTVHTDSFTGCQYLSFYGLTPRLDAQGRPICERKP